ncbi:MAG: allophanate hydrolase [Caldimonas sp.]
MPRLQTIDDWTTALRNDGVGAPDLLRARLHEIRTSSLRELWIHIATDAELEGQLVRLAGLANAHRDRASLLEAHPLFGVPFAVKDNIDIAGVPTTAACPAFEHVAEATARVVQKLQDAGAVWLGKTNLDQFATGLVGTRSPFGRPASVFAADRISGGSSSGSAVAVARGDVPFALGTDTAGSGRVPAGFNGIVGLKPTPGRVSTAGVVPACRSLDCVSIFATDVAEAAVVLSVIEGNDADDIYSRFVKGPAEPPAPLRLGIPMHPFFFGDAAYDVAWSKALDALRLAGVEPLPIDFSLLDETAGLLYGGPWVAERRAVVQTLLEQKPEAFDPIVRRVIEGARAHTATDAFRAQYRLRELQRRIAPMWTDVDALLVPTTTGHPTLKQLDDDPIGVNMALGRYTNFVNLLGWCGIALPAGLTPAGLPFGVTLLMQGSWDAALARLAQRWAPLLGGDVGAGERRGDAVGDISAIGRPGDAASAWPATQRTLALAVVGAHLSGLPLNGQLVERHARLRKATRTAPAYRLYALPGTMPPKPGLVRVAEGGASIEIEVWDVPEEEVGGFLAGIPAPLGLGSLELLDGTRVHGFLCEAHAVVGATDITSFGGWRGYVAATRAAPASVPR